MVFASENAVETAVTVMSAESQLFYPTNPFNAQVAATLTLKHCCHSGLIFF